jgi:GH15 family glucan-1,4-alpha-glucosidase
MDYQPIESYGIIGNMRSVALVSINGSIDWFCFPRFDSSSVFAAILDDKKGGRFRISPSPVAGGVRRKQRYWPDTNVLVTTFFTSDAVGQVTDYMPVGGSENGHWYPQLIRRVEVARGSMPFRMECFPAFDYARQEHTTEITEGGASFRSPQMSMGLAMRLPEKAEETLIQQRENGVAADFILKEGDTAVFVFQQVDSGAGGGVSLSEQEEEKLFKQTVDYWHRWLSKCTYTGRWREMVHRSALTLKLLTYEPTGAIVAAPTSSLPEEIGGKRNWDYRYTWLRDASFTVYSLLRIGFTEEAEQFTNWLGNRSREAGEDGSLQEAGEDGPLQIMYGIDGRHDLTEETLDHLEGYGGSSPVHVGNGAYKQLQLDIYGELMDAIYLYNKKVTPISYDLWTYLQKLIDWVCGHWRSEDEGVWEVRGGRRHFVYSKLMCWVAVDRGLRLADKRSFPADRERWLKVRDEIYEEIMKQGWSSERRAFVQAYGGETLDASNLMMPMVFFVSPKDPRMVSTLEAINRPPKDDGLVSNSLVFRYDAKKSPDGLTGAEGTFSLCTFWLVEALTRAGRLEEARLIFEQMLGYANHLGLYAEEISPSGEALGNFPQAFTHLSLISAAYNLDQALEGTRTWQAG